MRPFFSCYGSKGRSGMDGMIEVVEVRTGRSVRVIVSTLAHETPFGYTMEETAPGLFSYVYVPLLED